MRWKLDVASVIFTIFFVLEILVKVIGDGLFCGAMPYLQSPWNIFNVFLVVVSLVDIVYMMTFPYRPRILTTLKILQLFRVLRMMTESIMMNTVLEPLVDAVSGSITAVGTLTIIFMFLYSLLCIQLFRGSFYYCEGSNLANIRTKANCLNAGYQWLRKPYDFNSVPFGMLTMSIMFTMDGWSDIMYNGINSVGVEQQPVHNNKPWAAIIFVSFMWLSFFLADMFIGAAAEGQQYFLVRRREQLWSLPRIETRRTRYTLLQMRAQAILFDPRYKAAINLSVFFSVALMGVDMRHQTTSVGVLVILCQVIFTGVLTSEILITLVGYGFRRFLSNKLLYGYFFITLIMGINLSLDVMQLTDSMTFSPTALRVFRLLRYSQALRAKTVRKFTAILVKSLQWIFPLCVLLAFVLVVYANVGVDAFSTLECSKDYPCIGLNRYANFKDFGPAFLTVIRIFTGDNWSDLWIDASRPCRPGNDSCVGRDKWIPMIYFVSFVIISQIILWNTLLAFVIEAVEQNTEIRHEEELKEDEREWELEDRQRGVAAAIAAAGSCSRSRSSSSGSSSSRISISSSRSKSSGSWSSSGSCSRNLSSSSGSCSRRSSSRSSSSGELEQEEQQRELQQVQEEQESG
nr:voltage-dependent T-type calcium channel subunit alpha-1H-like [Nothobranchius furzeri]